MRRQARRVIAILESMLCSRSLAVHAQSSSGVDGERESTRERDVDREWERERGRGHLLY